MGAWINVGRAGNLTGRRSMETVAEKKGRLRFRERRPHLLPRLGFLDVITDATVLFDAMLSRFGVLCS